MSEQSNRDELIDRYGEHGRLGAVGEDRFTAGLATAFADRYSVFRSLRIPMNNTSQAALRGDVDIAVANGTRMVLVDVKLWRNGSYASLFGHLPIRDRRPHRNDRGEWRLSSNMGAALERWREALPGIRVSALVAFEPSDGRDGVPDVSTLLWPGARPALPDSIEQRLPNALIPYVHGLIRSFPAGAAYGRIEAKLGKTASPLPEQFRTALEAHSRPPRAGMTGGSAC